MTSGKMWNMCVFMNEIRGRRGTIKYEAHSQRLKMATGWSFTWDRIMERAVKRAQNQSM